MSSLTPKQLETARFVRDYVEANGYGPTLQEIADARGVSKITVYEGVALLLAKGVLKHTGIRGAPRILRYVESSGALPPVPTRSNAEIAAEIAERLVAEGATTPGGISRDKFVRIAADVLRREGR